ncbi:MAG: methyltransferase family protein, partial [Halobacteriota archaeon]
DRGSVLLILASIVIALIVAFSFGRAGVDTLPSWAFYPGVILMAPGILFRQRSIFVLGRFFSSAVRTTRNQTVVDTGPYRYVRHPSYTGAPVIWIGLGLAFQSWGAVLALVLIFAIAFGYRIRVEEQVLISQLGEAYIVHSQRKKRLIPCLF